MSQHDQPPPPLNRLSDSEIVAETFQAIRVRELTTVDQVKAVMLERFPDIGDDRRHTCLVKLADILVQANADLLTPDKQRQLGRRVPWRR